MKKKTRENLLYIGIYTVIFFLICMIVFEPFWSTGRSFVWKVDGWSQHYKALQFYSNWLQDIARNLLENHRLAIPLWSQCIGFGNDIVTILHYYVIGDPLCLLSVFAPDKYMVNCYDVLMILRIYLAGLAFYAFCRCRGIGREAESWADWIRSTAGLLAATCMYLFAGYIFVMGLRHPYFINPMIYLPLMLIGLEKIFQGRSPALFIFMVMLSAVSNFYFFYIIGCNVIVYAVVRLLVRYGIREGKQVIVKLLQTAGYAVVGICLSGIMLIPVIRLFLQAERTATSGGIQLFYESEFYENLPALFFTSIEGGTHHTLMGYSFIAFLCVIALFLERKRHTDRKVMFLVLTAVICLPLAGKVFHGFAYASNRWIFGYALLVAFIVAGEWDSLFSFGKKKLAVLALLSAVLTFYLWKKEELMPGAVFVSIIVLLFGTLLVLALFRLDREKRYIWLQSLLVFSLVIVSVCVNGFYCFAPQGYNRAASFKIKEEARNYLDAPTDIAVKNVVGDDIGYARYSAPFNLIERNSTLKSGLMSTHFYWSLAEKWPSHLFSELGLPNKTDHVYRELDSRTVIDTLTGVKYYVVRTGDTGYLPYGYVEKGSCQVDTEEGPESYTVYENTYALPIGYTYDRYMDRTSYEKLDEQDRERAMLDSVLLETDLPEYEKSEPAERSQELPFTVAEEKNVETEGNTFRVKKDGGKVTFRVNKQIRRSEVALRIKGLKFKGRKKRTKQLNITISEKKDIKKTVSKRLIYLTPNHVRYVGREDFFVNLGYSESGCEEITIRFPRKGRYSMDELTVLGLPLDGYEEAVSERKENVLEHMEIGTNRITGQISLEKSKILFLSIPYSEGWTARVDGKKTQVLRANTMFMALPLSEGSHEITLTYRTPWMNLGAGVSAFGILCCAAIAIMRKRGRQDQETV